MTMRIFTLFCLMGIGLYSCATKEDININPEMTVEKLTPAPSPFQQLKDSPSCIIPTKGLIDITTAKSLALDYGIRNDIDISSSIYSQSLEGYPFFECSIEADDYSGGGTFYLSFGKNNYIETGMYTTASYAGPGYDGNPNRYVKILLGDFESWGSTGYPDLPVRSGQKVLVVVNQDRTKARIKFCNLALDFGSVTNSGSITGEFTVSMN